MLRRISWILAMSIAVATLHAQTGAPGAPGSPAEYQALAKDVFKQLIEIDTTPSGSTTQAADAIAARLRTAGFLDTDVRVIGPAANRGNLVARLRGRDPSQKAIILLAHLDVVAADPKDWTVPPLTFTEKDGWIYGRGSIDDKDEAAVWTATLLRLKREAYIPNRDIVLMLTADEEGGMYNGVEWLIKEHRDLIDAAYALNEGGGGILRRGRRLSLEVQASEKTYQSFELLSTNRGGHSSLPRDDNAINQLASALGRIASFGFPIRLNDVTRAYFQRVAAIETPEIGAAMRTVLRRPTDVAAARLLSRIPEYNAQLRTTCVATMVEGGHADNALPQRARAVLNCRLLPGQSSADVLMTLRRVAADPNLMIMPLGDTEVAPPSPLTPEVLGPITSVAGQMWPGVPIIPTMSTGATDGLYLRRAGIPVYGVSGVFEDIDDVRAHGQDERIRESSFLEGLEFGYRLVKRLTGG